MRIQNALFRDAFEYTVWHLRVVCDHLVLPIHSKVGAFGLMAHMAPRTLVINSGTLAIPVLPGKVLPQRIAEPVQQIRFCCEWRPASDAIPRPVR